MPQRPPGPQGDGLAKRVTAVAENALAAGGAGAALGVRRHGKTLFEAGYGFADLERRIPMTPRSGFRICSVTKQFTCLLALLMEERGLLSLDDPPGLHLPRLPAWDDRLRLHHLCRNQSGIPDYWCLAMLAGARPQSTFRREHAERIVAGIESLDFAPGSAFAYSNTNFAILGWVLEAVTGTPLERLLEREIFTPLGMRASFLSGSTAGELPGGTRGYEPGEGGAPVPAPSDIHWAGDAGIVSTLEDLLRWERCFERAGPRLPGAVKALCASARALAAPAHYDDGRAAPYRMGIRVTRHRGRELHSHQGALRGWRMARVRLPGEELSVVAMFNFMIDPMRVALEAVDAVLELPPQPLLRHLRDDDRSLAGDYLSASGDLCARITAEDAVDGDTAGRRLAEDDNTAGRQSTPVADRTESLRFSCGGRELVFSRFAAAEPLRTVHGDAVLAVAAEPGVVTLELPPENRSQRFRRIDSRSGAPRWPAGEYFAPELAARMTIRARAGDGDLRFEGPLGVGYRYALRHLGDDVYAFECKRALDHPPPGVFTLAVERDDDGVILACTLGCWLARSARFLARKNAGGPAV